MTPQQRIDRGHAAKQLLDSEVLRQAFADMRASIVAHWEGTEPNEGDFALKLQVRLLKDVESQLRRYISDGAIEARKKEQ